MRRVHYEGLIWRFNFLMITTMVTALLTVIGFAIGQVEEGKYHWSEDVVLEAVSGFMTGSHVTFPIFIISDSIFVCRCLWTVERLRDGTLISVCSVTQTQGRRQQCR